MHEFDNEQKFNLTGLDKKYSQKHCTDSLD